MVTDASNQDDIHALEENLARLDNNPVMASFPPSSVFAFDTQLRFLGPATGGDATTFTRGVIAGRTIDEVFDPACLANVERHYRAALAGERVSLVVPYLGRHYSHQLTPVAGTDGETVAVVGFSTDVTEARRVQAELRQSEQQLRLTAYNAPIGQAIVDLDGHWRTVNPALAALTGYTPEQLLGMTFQDITHPDDLDLDLDLLRRLLEREIDSYRMEKRYFDAAGDIIWVLLSVALVRDDDGDPLYFVSQILDITRLKQHQAALQDLTAMLAHDLRTPTAVVAGSAETLLSAWDVIGDAERRAGLQRISDAADRMCELLDNSLTTSALDARGLRVQPAWVDLRQVVREALDMIDFRNVIVTTSDVGDHHVWMDRGHLQRVLINLCTNANKYGGDRLTLASRVVDGAVELWISDNGPGISAEFVPRMFERFTRSASAVAGAERGSGLGLYIVRDILTLNAANIQYHETPGGGATFRLQVPAKPIAPKD
ncbi:sensor histidine kinase [Nocardioides marmoraquaticus]